MSRFFLRTVSFVASISLMASIFVTPVFAAGDTLINPLKNTISADKPLQSLAAVLINTMFGIAGTVALFMFVLGGFLWLASAGNEKWIEKGKNIFQWSTAGLVVMFSAYVIVQYLFGTLLSPQIGAPPPDTAPTVADANAPGNANAGPASGATVCCKYSAEDGTLNIENLTVDACKAKNNAAEQLPGKCEDYNFCSLNSCAVTPLAQCKWPGQYELSPTGYERCQANTACEVQGEGEKTGSCEPVTTCPKSSKTVGGTKITFTGAELNVSCGKNKAGKKTICCKYTTK